MVQNLLPRRYADPHSVDTSSRNRKKVFMAEEYMPVTEHERKKGKLPILVIVIGVLIGVGVGAVILGPVAAPLFAERGDGGGHGEAPAVRVHLVNNLVVNPAGSNGRRLLMASIAIDVGIDSELIPHLEAAEFDLRARFNRVFERLTLSELADLNRRDSITVELKAVTEEVIGRSVRRVFLPQFILQ